MAKKIIRLTESELKSIISEHVTKILKEAQRYYTWDIGIKIYDIDFPDELNNFLDEIYENDMEITNTISVQLEYEMVPYDAGDYLTPSSGGGCNIVDVIIDQNDEFKSILPDTFYKQFISAVYTYVQKHMDTYCEKINKYHDYDD